MHKAASQNTVSILDVAEDVVTIETCMQTTADFAGAAVRHERQMNPFVGWATVSVTLRAYRLRNVVLDRSLMVLLKNGCVIEETNYLQSDESIAAVRVYPQNLVHLDTNHLLVTCFDHWDANYYHWMRHTVPIIHAIRQRHADTDIGLIVPHLRPWQKKSLELIGASQLPCVVTELGAQYFIPVVEYYDFVAGRADFAISPLSHAAYAAMSARIEAASPLHRRIYIDRSNTINRRVPNEPALVARLRERGFSVVRLEALALEEQIALFKGASMVVGLHGAGFTNIAFCQPRTVVYELIPEHYRNPCFLVMALQGDLNYWADSFATGVTGTDHTSQSSTDIDVDIVLRRLDELEALVPPNRRRHIWPRRALVKKGPPIINCLLSNFYNANPRARGLPWVSRRF